MTPFVHRGLVRVALRRTECSKILVTRVRPQPFRPLKMISNSPSLQVVMSAILKALGPIMNIFVLLIFFIVVFAIIGVEYYAGGFHSFW